MFKINDTRPRRATRKINFCSVGPKAGFSIVEIMTVLFVVSVGMLGVMSLIIQNIQSQSVNKGALIAYQLAQEGIEMVRYTRDSNWAAGRAWNYNLGVGHYVMDYLDAAPRTITIVGQNNLKQDSSGYYYNPRLVTDTNLNSGFSRVIDITANSEDPSNPSTMHVQTTVAWNEYNRNFTYVLDTNLYDWK